MLMAAATSAAAQLPQPMPLRPADAVLKETFISLNFGRELADGRVIICDPQQGELMVADFSTGKVESVTAAPGGPGYFPERGGFFPLTGDSTLLVEAISHQWVLLVGAHVVAAISPAAPMVEAAPFGPFGVDTIGQMFVPRSPPLDPHGMPLSDADSEYVVLVDLGTGREDTVTRLRQVPPRPTGAPVPVYQVFERAALSLDGWLAVIRMDPYRVDWRAPTGQWIHGAPIPYQPVPMSDAERRAVMASPHYAEFRDRADLRPAWPDTVPPAISGAPRLFSPQGQLLVLRTRTVLEPGTRYDVIDRTGALAQRLVLPDSELIVGFGPRSVYVDAGHVGDGIRLVRHPWPQAAQR